MKIEDAKRIVNSWPEWKKHLLENSMKPTCPRRDTKIKKESIVDKNLVQTNFEYLRHRPSWNHTFMTMAYELAKRSHDCQTQHGSIIVNDRKQILGAGYNGFIKGIDDSKLPNIRPDKYPWMIHSELNAIMNCEHRPVGATIYITGHPCLHCYQCIYQAGISVIIYDARPERNAVMIDETMMDNIRLLEKLIDGRIIKVPYYYEPENPFQIYENNTEVLYGDKILFCHDEVQILNCKKCGKLCHKNYLSQDGICENCTKNKIKIEMDPT